MKIRVDTQKPFQGIIHGPNRTEPGCSVLGKSGLKTYLNIDLTAPSGSEGSCGVKYNQRTEERKVAIAVRAHPTIELLEDRLYVVTCGRVGFQNSRNEVSVVQLKVSLPTDPTRKIDTVLEGKRYKLRAEVLEHDAAAVYCSGFGPADSDWLMWLCIAFGVLFAVMLLINIFLCSAMTCSCTRSEIIEKEPSVYDDYSIYDSQYGYTNNGKTYSESDYGSEYGMMDNGDHADPGRAQMSTPGGRLPSEYSQSHHGSTLNRSKY